MADEKYPNVRRVNPSSEEDLLLWTSLDTNPRGARGQRENADDILRQNADLLSRINETPAARSPLDIWKSISAGSFYNTHPQRAIQNIAGITPGDNLVMFDTEILGTFRGKEKNSLKWYSPTEIAFSSMQVGQNGTISPTGKRLSLLVAPDSYAVAHMENMINDLSRSKGKMWYGMSPDQRRTLSDLMLYAAENPNEIFEFKNGVTHVKGQRRDLLPLKGSVLATADNIGLMQLGLQNLIKHGNAPQQIIDSANGFMADMGQYKIGGYNIYNFDLPLMQDYLHGMLGQDNPDSKVRTAIERLQHNLTKVPQIDVLQGINALYKNPMTRFGKDLKLENVIQTLGLATGNQQSHFGAYDAEMTGKVLSKLMSNGEMQNYIKESVNTRPVQIGTRFFADAGIGGTSPKKGAYDAIYRMGENGFELAYNMKNQNPIYRGAVYKVHGMYDDLDINGKKHVGMMLFNEDENLYHFIARDNINDLQSIVQEHLSPLNRNRTSQAMTGLFDQRQQDRALRRYLRMYSDEPLGGVDLLKRMHAGLDALTAGEKAGLKGPALENHVRQAKGFAWNDTSPASAEYYRDLTKMRGRLEAERPYVDKFLGALQTSSIKDDVQAQGIALRNFKGLMDENFGRNETNAELTNKQKVFQMNIDGDVFNINLGRNTAIEGSLRSALGRGHEKNMSISIVKKRLKQMVLQVQAKGAITGQQADQFNQMIEGLRSSDRTQTILRELSSHMERAAQNDATFGLKTITVEDPTTLHAPRINALKNPTTGFDVRGERIMSKAIAAAEPFHQKGFNNISGTKLASLIGTHDAVLQNIIDTTGLVGSNVSTAQSAKDTLSGLANAFSKNDTATAFLYSEKHKGLVMAIASTKDAESIFKLQPNEIIAHNKVAVVSVPMLDDNGNLVMPGQSRVGRVKAMKQGGNYYFGTGFEETVAQLQRASSTATRMMQQGKAIETQSWLNSIVRTTVQNMSLNNKRANLSDGLDWTVDSRSNAATWLRGGIVDISIFAEDWYKTVYGDTKYANKKSGMKSGQNFVETLSQAEQLAYHRNIDSYLQERNIHVNMHSVKDTHVAQSLRAGRDARALTPFGYYNPMARENLFKSVNYLSLDSISARTNLLDAGVDVDKVQRMMSRGFVTDTAMEVLGNETNYLSVRAGYMDSGKIAKIFNDSNLSTYEGMFILADDVAGAYATKRDKNIRLSPGAELTDKIKEIFGPDFDSTQSYALEGSGVRLTELGRKGGKVTVGQIMTNGELLKQTDFYDGWNNNVFVKGWDAETRTLLTEEYVNIGNGTKFTSDVGDRVTATIVQRSELQRLATELNMPELEHLDAIFEPTKLERRQAGSELYKAVGLVYDEAMRISQKEGTVGKLLGQEVLPVLQELMDQTFKTGNAVRIENNKLVIENVFGIKTKADMNFGMIDSFFKSASAKLGIQDFSQTTMQGQVGLALANVYDWENSIGHVRDGSRGLVRWGYKERGVIAAHANNYLGEGNSIVGWLDDYVSRLGAVQGENTSEYSKSVVKAFRGYRDPTLRAGQVADGEVVIRTQGREFLDGPVRMNGNTAEVSMHAFNELPRRTKKGLMNSVDDYAGTILDLKGVQVGKDVTVGSLIKDGTFLFELPDQFSHKYVRFVDTNVTSIGDMPVLKEIQKSQMSIWRLTQQYMDEGGEDAKTKLQDAVYKHEETLRYINTSGREGSLTKMNTSAALDMSGRFRAQTFNPLNPGQYEEGVQYVSRHRMEEMIRGAETDIAKSVGIHDAAQESFAKKYGNSGMTDNQLDRAWKGHVKQEVLDYATRNGLYSFVNRYPTISEDTVLIMKTQIDPTMKKYDRQMKIGMATQARLKMDNDGDFGNTVLAHYSYNNGNTTGADLHKELAKIWEADKAKTAAVHAQMFAELQKQAADENVTVQQIWNNHESREKLLVSWRPRISELDAAESGEARIGKQLIGIADNTRQKMFELADVTYDVLGNKGLWNPDEIKAKRAILDDFGKTYSQNLISSKKFQVEDIRTELRDAGKAFDDPAVFEQLTRRTQALDLMMTGMANPDADGRKMINIAEAELGIFEKSKHSLDQMLDTYQELHRLTGRDTNFLDNPFLKFGKSEGLRSNVYDNMLQGRGGRVIPVPAIKALAANDEEFGQMLAERTAHFENTVINNYDRMFGPGQRSFFDMSQLSAVSGDEMLDVGTTVAERTGVKFRQTLQNFSLGEGSGLISGMQGAKMGAAMFGALWAGSALMRSGPTPESTTGAENGVDLRRPEQTPPPALGMMSNPTARVQENGESINVRIAAKDARNMSQEQISALVQQELNAMMNTKGTMSVNFNDNTQSIDRGWLQGVVANAINNGFAF